MTSIEDDLLSSDDSSDLDYCPEPTLSSDEDEPLQTVDEKPEDTLKPVAEIIKVKETKKADEIFKNFLEEVESEMKAGPSSSSAPVPSTGCEAISNTSTTPILLSNGNTPIKDSVTTVDKVPAKFSDFFEFAGETVSVDVNGTILNSETTDTEPHVTKSQSEAPGTALLKKRGLGSVLGAIMNKKIKLSTLEKSALDWKTFKKEKNLAEDIEKFNKGKGGFIERQRFLQRSDFKVYEKERDMRFLSRKITSID